MSASVSQIEFWQKGLVFNGNNGNNGNEGENGGTFLSYDVFLGLSIVGGFLALDHLYLRSPLTFLAKLVINIMFFGIWWVYDATQAIFNGDTIKVYGLGVPGFGPKGIACGVLAKEEPDKKHMRFFMYAAALIFGGMFGLDSFLVGNKQRGIIRLVLMISFIFAPIALAWWGWNMVRFFTDTKQVVSEHAGYFGAASSSVEEEMLARWPFLSSLFSPVQTITKIINEILQPFQQTAESAIKTVDSVVKTADDAILLGKTAIEKGSNIVGEIAETVDKATSALSSASSALPGLDLYKSISPEGVAKQTGGSKAEASVTSTAVATSIAAIATSDLNMLHYTLIGTIVLIAITGLTLTYYRSKNVRPTKDDTPPEPGVFRKPDSKERPT